MIEMKAKPCIGDPCVYYIRKEDDVVLIATYIDDFFVSSENAAKFNDVKKKLSEKFDMKDLGEVSYCLGIEFSKNEDTYSMHQRGYITELIHRFRIFDAKTVTTLLCPTTKLQKPAKDSTKKKPEVPYRELIG